MSIASMNLELNVNQSLAILAKSQPMVRTGFNREVPQTLDDAMDSLISSMIGEQGKVNRDNPLVKLLAAYLQLGGSGGPQGPSHSSSPTSREELAIDQLQDALSEMLEQVLGKGLGIRAGCGGSGQDMISRLLSGLVQYKLNAVLQPAGDGSATFSPEDSGVLHEVARLMDQHPETFGPPDNASGAAHSWSNEVGEKNTLNSAEADAFRQAIQMIAQSVRGGNVSGAWDVGNSQEASALEQGARGGPSGGLVTELTGNIGAVQGSKNINVTMSADDFLELMKTVKGSDAQGSGATAQCQSLNENVSQAATEIINGIFS
jgi:hypothetical protein